MTHGCLDARYNKTDNISLPSPLLPSLLIPTFLLPNPPDVRHVDCLFKISGVLNPLVDLVEVVLLVSRNIFYL